MAYLLCYFFKTGKILIDFLMKKFINIDLNRLYLCDRFLVKVEKLDICYMKGREFKFGFSDG